MISKIFGERCVRCDKARTKKEYEGLPTCEACELELLAAREVKRACPACNASMEKTIVQKVIVDKCPACHGAWLDGGELDLVKKAMESGESTSFATGMILGMAVG
jgi:hypothetical protein